MIDEISLPPHILLMGVSAHITPSTVTSITVQAVLVKNAVTGKVAAKYWHKMDTNMAPDNKTNIDVVLLPVYSCCLLAKLALTSSNALPSALVQWLKRLAIGTNASKNMTHMA